MPEILENFYGGNLFTFINNRCVCYEDVVHESIDADPTVTLKFFADTSKNIKLAYAPKKGLVRIDSVGSIKAENILGTFIGLSVSNTKKLESFFSDNGFLFPLTDDQFISVSHQVLQSFIRRMRTTVEIMSEIGKAKPDYLKMLFHSFQLIFSDSINIGTEYTSCYHSIKQLIEMGHSILDTPLRKREAVDSDVFEIQDSTQTNLYQFDINEYNDIKDKYNNYPPEYQSIATLFINYDGNPDERCFIDVLFHYFHDIQNPKSTYTLSDTMNQRILRFSKLVIGEEINHNLKGITPVYNTEKMEPAWNVTSLISAMYLSLFYLKPNMELYRPCENPNCNNYFLVKATSSKTKYCCTRCANSVTQARYRKKNK